SGLRAGGHAERRAERPGTSAPVPWRGAQTNPDPLGNAGAGLEVGLGEPDSELLAPDAGSEVAAADLALDDAGEVDQRGITGGVPQRVVEQLEAVEIGVHQRARAWPPRLGLTDQLVELAPVREPGEPVRHRVGRPLVGLKRAGQ